MPKWFGMTIHYLTFKKVLTSRKGWVFTWGGPRKADRVLVLYPPPPSGCSCCKTQKTLERQRVQRDRRAEARSKVAAKAVVADEKIKVEVVGDAGDAQNSIRNGE